MSESRSAVAHGYWKESSEKFDYYVTALTAALCAYIGQSFLPEKLKWSPNTLELVALSVLAFSVFAGFRKIEVMIVFYKLNHEFLQNGEQTGALKVGLAESTTGMVINQSSGEVWTVESAEKRISELENRTTDIMSQQEIFQKRANRWYKLRNRSLFVGFTLLVASRVLMAYYK